jgi:hypothetical protein
MENREKYENEQSNQHQCVVRYCAELKRLWRRITASTRLDYDAREMIHAAWNAR